MDKYILLADCDEQVLHLQETALKYFYGGDIVLVKTIDEAVNVLDQRGRPELVFADFQLLVLDNGRFHNFLQRERCMFRLSPAQTHRRPKTQ